MISEKRYAIAQAAERDSHILKKGIDVFNKRLNSARAAATPSIQKVEKALGNKALRVLDLGSGPTCIGRFFSNAEVTYLDPLMDFFKDYYKNGELPKTGNLVAGMAEDTKLPAGSFDAVICYNVLDHTYKPRQIMAEAARVLKPGGCMLLGIYTHGPLMKTLRVAAEMSWVFKERPHPYSFHIQDILAIVKPDFHVESCEKIQGEEKFFNTKRRFYIIIARKKAA